MIRIKCPKCAKSLAVDDEDAGSVGQCDECGAKFRIPAAKPKVEGVKAGAAPRGPSADDDEEAPPKRRRAARDDDDVDDEEDRKPARPRRKKAPYVGMNPQTRMNIQMGLALGVFVILLGMASLWISKIGLIIWAFGLVAYIIAGLALLITIWQDSPLWGFLILFVPGLTIVYAIMNWHKIAKLVLVQLSALMVCIAGVVLGGINEGWRAIKREIIWNQIRQSSMRMVDETVAMQLCRDPAMSALHEPRPWEKDC